MLRRAPARGFASRRHGLLDALKKAPAKAPAKPPATAAIKAPAAVPATPAEAPASKPAPRPLRGFAARKLKVDLDKLNLRWLKPNPIAWLPSGYVKPVGHTEAIPFQFTRTAQGNLPIYRDIRNQRTRILTEVRNYNGDVATLEQEIRKIVQEAKVERRYSHFVIQGDWANELRSWLYRLGF